MNDLNINKTRIWENWANREPEKGKYNWSGLDTRINFLHNAGKDFMLTIKPTGIIDGKILWYCKNNLTNANSCVFNTENEDSFRQYIENIITRYPGKINEIQFQNEWITDYHFIGTAADYIKYANILYDTVKQYSPSTTVVLGSIPKAPLVYLAGCQLDLLGDFYSKNGSLISDSQRSQWCQGTEILDIMDKVNYVFANAKYDMVDIHLYDDPENWDEYLEAFNEHLNLKNKPVIVTEFGGPNEKDKRYNAYDETFQANELQKYLDKLIELPIKEAYYFKMIEGGGIGISHSLTGLMKIDNNGQPVKKATYNIFKKNISDMQK